MGHCLADHGGHGAVQPAHPVLAFEILEPRVEARRNSHPALDESGGGERAALARHAGCRRDAGAAMIGAMIKSEEHTSELQSLMRNSYAVFCLKKKKKDKQLHK